MSEKKNLTMTFRLKPSTKDGLEIISERESRSIANSIEWLVKDYFVARSLPWPPKPEAEAPAISAPGTSDSNKPSRSKGEEKQ